MSHPSAPAAAIAVTERTIQARPSPAFLLVASGTIAAFVLRAYALGREPLWRDEALVYWLSQDTLGQLLSPDLARTGIHPPLFYVLHLVWERLMSAAAIERSEVSVRALSVLIGSLTVPLNYALAKRFYGTRIALISSFLLVFSAYHIDWSRQAKTEILSVLLSTITYSAALTLAERLAASGSIRRRDGIYGPAAAYALSAVAALYTHSTGFCVLIVSSTLFLALSLSRRRPVARALTAWILLNAIVVLAYTPWIGPLLDITGHRTGYYWFRPVSLHEALEITVSSYGFGGIKTHSPLGAAVLVLLVAGFARAIFAGGKGRAVALGAMVFPPALFLISCVVPIFLERVIVPYTLGLVITLLAFGIDYLLSIRIVGLVTIYVVALATALSLQVAYAAQREPWNLVAAHLERNRDPSEPLLLWPAYAEWSLRYYLPGDTRHWATVALDDGRVEFRPFRAVAILEASQITGFLGDAAGVWLVEDKKEEGWTEALEARLSALYPKREATTFLLGLRAEHFYR